MADSATVTASRHPQSPIRSLAVPIFVHPPPTTGIAVAQIFSVCSAKFFQAALIGSQCAEMTGEKRMAQLVLENH
jgi:hypothetical protein